MTHKNKKNQSACTTVSYLSLLTDFEAKRLGYYHASTEDNILYYLNSYRQRQKSYFLSV